MNQEIFNPKFQIKHHWLANTDDTTVFMKSIFWRFCLDSKFDQTLLMLVEQIQSLLLPGMATDVNYETKPSTFADLARQVLTVMVSRCSIRVRKQYAAEPSSVRPWRLFYAPHPNESPIPGLGFQWINSSRCGSGTKLAPGFAHLPLHIVGQHAKENMRSETRSAVR